ncbi:MAG TPA: hypothetical protein VHV76_14980 [Mycobacteriales bacterium]|nr:hypothetical protein [Mycobacteriales bacterium]
MTLGAGACAPAASTTGLDQLPPRPQSLHAATLSDVAVDLAHEDGRPVRKSVYLRPLRRLDEVCAHASVSSVASDVEFLAGGIVNDRVTVSAPHAAAASALVADARRGTDCKALASHLLEETAEARPSVHPDWGGYAGTLAAWRAQHRADRAHPGSYHPRRPNGVDAYQVPGSSGRVYSMVERFSPPLAADLVLASIENSLMPGQVHAVYELKAAQCQQVIFMGPGLAAEFGNSSLGAFVELSSGNGVGRTPYDADRVDKARITPLGRIGGEPCTT